MLVTREAYLVVDTAFEASGTPVNKLDGTLRLDGSDGSVHVLQHKKGDYGQNLVCKLQKSNKQRIMYIP